MGVGGSVWQHTYIRRKKFRKESGVFLLNPQYFGKGEWKDIAKIRYEAELNPSGKTLRLKELEEKEA
ncbi:hypothetical protein COC69_12390 [Bacillus cereus]|uniref:Uncharacterized protein n=1 Tax=Bacillus cereus TaxID=1396 RepID=A0A9X7CNR8_BACCE|nr:hypothetical protein [Bacillus cereus]PGS79406.1 hypothetical protein COC69_12390 [Bacillus cereus]